MSQSTQLIGYQLVALPIVAAVNKVVTRRAEKMTCTSKGYASIILLVIYDVHGYA